ncbi:Uncharacterized protein OBRU01_16498 [Operophtera brumata]|uniref:Uncharacterized protein n=1 Tax=Operophtera brumata TaxID=104452 RepID=A0A0L7L2I6_OPEBR|nr:Uncharacterized protein OBRU01_16498 [Operophtera brumata]
MADDAAGPSGMNLGGVISEKLSDTIKNMDIMTVLQKMVATTPEDEESEEIRQKLQGVLAQFNSLSDDEKETFTAKIKEGLASKISARLQDPNSMDLSGLEEAIGTAIMNQIYMVAAAILFFIIIIGMFF